MNIALLTIGDELLNGDLADTNTAAICQSLAAAALSVKEAATVGDRIDDIAAALTRLAENYDTVIVSGGLGPTTDDLTAKAAAKAFGRPLAMNDEALQQIRTRFKIMRREMHPANEKQAMLPARSSVMANRHGTAPGFSLRHNDTGIYFLPGVPGEMLAMLNSLVIPALQKDAGELPEVCRRNISVFGLPEPEVESRLIGGSFPAGVRLAFNVEFPLVIAKLAAQGGDAQQQVDRAELYIRKQLGDFVIGNNDDTLAGVTAHLLTAAGLTLALAESCTGGLVAKLLTDQSGASAFLERSMVTYANSAKTDCLNVPGSFLERHGAVSAECASAMAKGAKAKARTDIALSITGVAGPDGGTDDKPVGTVFISMTAPGCDQTERFHFPGHRDQVRLRTACTALDWLRRYAISRMTTDGGE